MSTLLIAFSNFFFRSKKSSHTVTGPWQSHNNVDIAIPFPSTATLCGIRHTNLCLLPVPVVPRCRHPTLDNHQIAMTTAHQLPQPTPYSSIIELSFFSFFFFFQLTNCDRTALATTMLPCGTEASPATTLAPLATLNNLTNLWHTTVHSMPVCNS